MYLAVPARTTSIRSSLALLLLLALAPAAPTRAGGDALVAYWPFDGTPAIALGNAASCTMQAADLSYADGVAGRSLRLLADCRCQIGERFPARAGTFAAWIHPEFSGPPDRSRTIFCIYGAPDLSQPWARNRWSLVSAGARLSFSIYPDAGGRPLTADAQAKGLLDGNWHHVAVTWSGVNAPDQNATLRIYLDGVPVAVAVADAPGFVVGKTSGHLDLGRDSDSSPDYGEMRMDDAFLYARALAPEEIAAGVAATAPGKPRAIPEERSVTVQRPDWDAPELPCRITLDAPASRLARKDWSVYATPALAERFRELGLDGTPDVARARVFTETGSGSWTETELGWDDESLYCPVPGDWPAGSARRFRLYLDAIRHSSSAPLIAAAPRIPGAPRHARAALPDYAQEAYADAWDFDEGDKEEIDGFGNRPEFIRDVRVTDGALHAKVKEDAYIIWGSMWGEEDRGKRRLRLDVSRYPVLVLRLRQSAPRATWKIYGRPLGKEHLLSHEFEVTGTGWQTVRVDLARDARWTGVLSAFRINLTKDLEADVALDFVRLVRGSEARVGPVETPGHPSAPAARVALTPDSGSQVAGTEQALRVRVEDASGKPVARQPIRVTIVGTGGTTLLAGKTPSVALEDDARRAITDEIGHADFRLAAGPRAGAIVTIEARAEFVEATIARADIAIRAGAPTRYAVGPPDVTIAHKRDAPIRLRVVATDDCGNAIPLPGRKIEWRIDEARTAAGSAVTAADGAEILLHPDMARRWVYRARVRDDAGLAGESREICLLPNGASADKITLKDASFRTPTGRTFVPLGGFYAVWIPRIPKAGEEEGRDIRAFTEATEAEMHHWFAFLRSQGVTALRMMLRTHGPRGTEAMDVGGRVNRPLFAKTLRLMDIARKYDLRFMLTLHDDYNKPVYVNPHHLETFALPRFAGEDLHALPPFQRRFLLERELLSAHDRYLDPDAIACQDQYAREIVGYLKDNPALFSWELENEMVDCPVPWVNHAVATIRAVDPITPICVSHGGGGLVTADPLHWTRSHVDFYTYHLYPLGTTSPEMDYGLVTDLLTRYGRMAGTCFLGESAGDEFNRYPAERDADRRWIMRDLIWFSLINRNPGCFFWNARGHEIAQFKLVGQILDRAGWLLGKRPAAPVAVDVSHPMNNDGWYRTPAGRKDLEMMSRYARHFLERGVEFDLVTGTAGAPGQRACDLRTFAPPAAPARFAPAPGYQVASATREDALAGLLYVRCAGGIRAWSPSEGRTLWLRERSKTCLKLQCQEPEGLEATAWDLDTGSSRNLKPANDGSLDLGTTDHDFVVLWERH